jgi:hypothetical protein
MLLCNEVVVVDAIYTLEAYVEFINVLVEPEEKGKDRKGVKGLLLRWRLG